MKVSIITCCFNREATIRDCIESVVLQDYPEIEYIIVDGASTDHSLEIIKEYREHISCIISETDSGMYEGINKGICASTGELIGLIHSDDFFYSTNTISRIVEKIQNDKADIIYGNGLFVDFNKTDKVIRKWISGEFSRKKICRGWLPLHPTVYIRREKLSQLGLYDESFKIAADSDFLIRYLYEADLKVSYLNEYVVKMRMGGLSTDPKKMRLKWGEDLRLYRNHGFFPLGTLICKILSKIPQFITAKYL